jgi:hypothetical protein
MSIESSIKSTSDLLAAAELLLASGAPRSYISAVFMIQGWLQAELKVLQEDLAVQRFQEEDRRQAALAAERARLKRTQPVLSFVTGKPIRTYTVPQGVMQA